MKGKLVLTLGLTEVLALSIGFAKDLQSTKVSAEEQPSKQADITTVITKEEQDMVEIHQLKRDLFHKKMEQGSFF
jgi:hypothetical protein